MGTAGARFMVAKQVAASGGLFIEEGDVGAGDTVRLIHRPAHGLTVAEVARTYGGNERQFARLLEAPELPAYIQAWARKRQGGL